MSKVALIGKNSVGFIERLIGIWNRGDCAVLLDWRIPIATAVEMMKEAGVKKCFLGKTEYGKIKEQLTDEIEFVIFDDECKKATQLPFDIYEKFKSNYSFDEAVVIYSSGTTGKAKGVILSHFAINTNADAIIEYMKPTADDCIYIAKTLAHSSTLTGELLVALKSHAHLLIAPTIVPPRVLVSNIQKNQVTIIGLNPTLLSMLIDEIERSKQQLKTLKTIYVSGSILNDKIYEKAHRTLYGIKIYNVYGLSEAGPRVAAQRADCCKGNSVGKVIKDVELAVVNDTGIVVQDGIYGMIHVNTPSLFAGYISGLSKQVSVYNGWLNTGDIGYIDVNGELRIVGRQDDVIIIDSHKIYPSEVEKQVLRIPSVTECAVVGIQIEDDIFLGCLYVGNAKIPDLRRLLGDSIPAYEIPKLIAESNKIPKSRNGKIDKKEVCKVISTICVKEKMI